LEDESYFLTRCRKLNHTAFVACTLVLKAMPSSKVLLSQVCRLCIEICTTCAEECDKFSHFKYCRESAAACREAVAACVAYLATLTDEHSTNTSNEMYAIN
jgi:Domain of Unknown Function (DUF326)